MQGILVAYHDHYKTLAAELGVGNNDDEASVGGLSLTFLISIITAIVVIVVIFLGIFVIVVMIM